MMMWMVGAMVHVRELSRLCREGKDSDKHRTV